MRFLADENVPRAAVEELANRGHDVASVQESAQGATDREVLRRARSQRRVLVTFDKDFGELAFSSARAVPGIILVRMSLSSPGLLARRVADVIDARADWAGHFSVIDDRRMRMRALPQP